MAEALRSLVDRGVLREVNNTYLEETYSPKAIAFHYCGDAEALAFAKKSTEIVLRVVQNLLDRELETDGKDQKPFAREDAEAEARALDPTVTSDMVRVGLALAEEFGVFRTLQRNSQQVGVTSFLPGQHAFELGDNPWNEHIRRGSVSVERVWEKNINESSPVSGVSLPRSHNRETSKAYKTAFDTYTVVRQVGSGGSGAVFLVTASDGQNLALKQLDRSKTPRQKLKRFQNEIKFCLQPGSEHIVQVLDYGQAPDGSLFYLSLIHI